MCRYIYDCGVRTHVSVHLCVGVFAYAPVCVQLCACVSEHICMHCICTCVDVWMCVYLCVAVYLHVQTHLYASCVHVCACV